MSSNSLRIAFMKSDPGGIYTGFFPFEEINQDKYRYLIVLKVEEERELALCLKCTTKEKPDPYAYKIRDWQDAGFDEQTFACCSKVVYLNIKDIDIYKGSMTDYDYDCVCDHYRLYQDDVALVEKWMSMMHRERSQVSIADLFIYKLAAERLQFTCYIEERIDYYRSAKDEVATLIRKAKQ